MIELDFGLLLDKYQTISLQDLNSSFPLTQRVDKKFVFPIRLLPDVLQQSVGLYDLLDINGRTIFLYRSAYFDTPDLYSYHQHHNGKVSRFKVRKRTYVESLESFWEIKMTNNKGFLQKTRLPIERTTETILEDNFLWAAQYIGEHAHQLLHAMEVTYQRITLLSKDKTEKVTLDMNVCFEMADNNFAYRNVVIAEVKKENDKADIFSKLMKSFQIQKGSISKYCLGLITLRKDLKHNNFKRKFERIKAINDGE